MKNFVLCVSFLVFMFLFAGPAAGAMLRVAAVTSSNTIVLEGQKVVTLRGVLVPAGEETLAREYLARIVLGKWVAVEDGDVFRSPDALYINGEIARRAYLAPNVHMTYLGELSPGPRAPQKPPAPKKSGFAKPRRRV